MSCYWYKVSQREKIVIGTKFSPYPLRRLQQSFSLANDQSDLITALIGLTPSQF